MVAQAGLQVLYEECSSLVNMKVIGYGRVLYPVGFCICVVS